jgi:PST family polysaccharide transporter/lipopolysaccharide exporter
MLVRNIYARLGSNLVRGGLSVISSILIIRILGVEVVGRIAYYYGLVGMFTLFTDMGISVAYRKFLTTRDSSEQDVGGYVFLRLGLILLFCIIVWVAHIWISQSRGFDELMFLIAFSVTLIDLVSHFFIHTMSGQRDFVFLSKIEVAGSFSLFLYNLAVCFLFPSQYFLALNMAVVPIFLIAGGIYYVRRHDQIVIGMPSTETVVRYAKYSIPLSVSSVVGLFTVHFEKVVLGRLIGIRELGFYQLALSIFSGFDKVIKPVTNTLFTELSYRINRSAEFMRERFRDLVQTLNMIAATLALLLIFASSPVVDLFYGVENMRTAAILQCYVLVLFSRLFWRPYRHVLYAIEAHHPIGYLSVIDLAIRLGLYYTLMPMTIGGKPLGAMAIPLIEFIIWIIPSGIYNGFALRKRFGDIHMTGVLCRIWLPAALIMYGAFLISYTLYLFPLCVALFLMLEYHLSVLTRERWDGLVMPLKDLLRYSGA